MLAHAPRSAWSQTRIRRGLAPDTLVDDRFVVLRLLGRGGMSCVYKVADLQSGDLVALKLLAPERHNRWMSLSFQRQIMLREAEILAALSLPSVVRLRALQVRELPFYLALDYLDGMTLAHFIARGLPARSTALLLADRIAAMIEALHQHRPPLLHLDIKPANIVLLRCGGMRLIDFGTACWLTDTGAPAPGMGTPDYAAPEHQAHQRLDVRADIYALGRILEDLVGEATVPASHPLRQILARATAPLAWQRYPAVAEFRRALQDLRRRMAASARCSSPV